MAEESSTLDSRFLPALRRLHISPVYLAIAGFVVSFLLFATVRRMEFNRIQSDLRRAGEANIASLSHGLDTHLLKLESLAGLHAGSEQVTRAEFRDFVQPILRRRGGVQSLQWIPKVPHDRKTQFIESARREGLADFMISQRGPYENLVPAENRQEYFPVFYVEPYEDNKVILGFDLCSEPNCCATMRKAGDTGSVALTERMQLVQTAQGRCGFLMIYPIYNKQMPIETLEQRRANLEGFYGASSDTAELLAYLLTQRPPRGVDIYIFDVLAPRAAQLLYFHPSRTRPVPVTPRWDHITEFTGYFHQITIDVADRKWLIVTTPAPAFIDVRRAWEPWAILGTGIAFSILLAAYVSVLLTSADNAGKFAAEESASRQRLQREVTARKRFERQREQLMAALADRNEEMANLLYVVSHDLRAPLVNIRGFSAELQNEAQQASTKLAALAAEPRAGKDLSDLINSRLPESAKFINASAEKMEKLLDGLRTLSRTGRLELKIERIEMNALMQKVVDSISFLVKEAGASVTIGQLPPCLGDVGQINQVFSNLLNNALKYLDPARPGQITVSGRTENETSVYAVRDNGIGIPASHHAKIFELFHRVNPDSSISGEGLGLTTVKQLVSRNNGTIWLESELGKGSSFFVALPSPPGDEKSEPLDNGLSISNLTLKEIQRHYYAE